MKNSFKFYIVAMLAVFGLFNASVFLGPSKVLGTAEYDGVFWLLYAFVTLAFIGHIACAYFVFRKQDLKKTFYNMALFNVSMSALIAIVIVGAALLSTVLPIPDEIAIFACCFVLAINIVSVVKAFIAIGAVEAVDKKVKAKTLFIKTLTADALVLMQNNAEGEMGILAKNIYEEIRYSDPMSDDALTVVESKISDAFDLFSDAVTKGEGDAAKACAERLSHLINERNAKCKILK